MEVIVGGFIVGVIAFVVFSIAKASYGKWKFTKTIKPTGTVSTMASKRMHAIYENTYEERRVKISDNPCGETFLSKAAEELSRCSETVLSKGAEKLRRRLSDEDCVKKLTSENLEATKKRMPHTDHPLFWRPKGGEIIRILPPYPQSANPGFVIRDFHFVDRQSVQCGCYAVNPETSKGECPICDWVSALRVYDDKKVSPHGLSKILTRRSSEAKKLGAKQRYHCNVVVRGDEYRPKIMSITKSLYDEIASIMVDHDNIWDLLDGRDINIHTQRTPQGWNEYFATINRITVAGTQFQMEQWMASIWNVAQELDDKQKTTEELHTLLDLYRMEQETRIRVCEKCGKKYIGSLRLPPTNVVQRYCSLECAGIESAKGLE